MKQFVWLLMGVWLSILIIRSGMYVIRIITESQNPSRQFHPEIVPCITRPSDLKYDEERYVYNFRALGTECSH